MVDITEITNFIRETQVRADAELEAERDPAARARRAQQEVVHSLPARAPARPTGRQASTSPTSSTTQRAVHGALQGALIAFTLHVGDIALATPDRRPAALARAARAAAAGAIAAGGASTLASMFEKAILSLGPELSSLFSRNGMSAALKAALVSNGLLPHGPSMASQYLFFPSYALQGRPYPIQV